MKAARLLLLVVAGCSLGHPDRERLGDVAWHEGRWTDAIAAYRASGDAPRLTAKLADAMLQAGMLTESAQAWTKLGVDAPERAAEAAGGLARVAEVAEQAGKQAALAQAVAGLRRVAPGWPLARVASRLSGVSSLVPAQAAAVVPAMLSGSPGRDATDPLLLALAQADRALGACDPAVPILEAVLRRTSNAILRDSAAVLLGTCELGLGLNALQATRPGEAERWLDRAVRRQPGNATGRRAQVGLGDARLRQGDTVAARLFWQGLATAEGTPDSVTQMALVRLEALVPPPLADSGTLHPVRP